jgi:hypothetical protein
MHAERNQALRLVTNQEIALIPAMEVLKFLQQHKPIPLSERNSAMLVQEAKARNFFLEKSYRTATGLELLAHIVKSQCEFNFVSPLLRLHDEEGWAEIRKDFCRILSREPYNLVRGDTPTALELSLNDGQRNDTVFGYSPALVALQHIDSTELLKADSLVAALEREGSKAVARLRDRSRECNEGDQLDVLAYCVILPTLFGIEPFTVPFSREAHTAAVEKNGDFYFPVPKFSEGIGVPAPEE